MNLNPKILIVRIILGLAGGWFLAKFFLNKDGGGTDWLTVLILAAIIVLAATASEAWRRRK